MRASVLAIENDAASAEMLSATLLQGGYFALRVADTQMAVPLMASVPPDLIVLSRTLPGNSAIEFLRGLRKSGRSRRVPVLMLSTRGSDEDCIEALEAGADDYLLKPISPNVLLARIRAALRRHVPQLFGELVTVHGLTLDPRCHRAYVVVKRAEVLLKVGPTEFKLLHYLLANPEKVHSRITLLDRVWGGHSSLEERTVDVHIKRLRTILKPYGYAPIIETVRGSGYRLSAQGMIDADHRAPGASGVKAASAGGASAVAPCR